MNGRAMGFAFPVLRHGDDMQVIPAHFLLQGIQGRHFPNTGCAPCRPQVDNDNLALEIRKDHVLAIAVLKRHSRDGPGILAPFKFLDATGCGTVRYRSNQDGDKGRTKTH